MVGFRTPKEDVSIEVKTGDKQGAGTDCKVWVILHDEIGRTSMPLRLNNRFTTNCRNQSSTFKMHSKMSDLRKVVMLEFWLEKFGLGELWFVEHFKVKVLGLNKSECIFPLHRWVRPRNEHFFIIPNDASLPQHTIEALKTQRTVELREKRQEYRYKQVIEGGPMQAAVLPSDEKFSDKYFFTFMTDKANYKLKTKFLEWTHRKWKSLKEIKDLYKKLWNPVPECLDQWDTDEWFGNQRIQGLNPMLITLCKTIPENFDVTDETVKGLLENCTLEEALNDNKIFIVDLKILDGVPCKEDHKLAAPLALFYLNKNNKLLPVALQLSQQKGSGNPVFTPKDLPNTWLVAKMHYNNAEAQHHQGISHLGFTHLLMEGICLCTHRNLSPSHPMFKLMAPHFLFLLAINARGLEKLISPGGWVEHCMSVGIEGIYEIIRRGLKSYNFYTYGNIKAEIASRGILDPEIMPYYPYRDDAVSLFDVIKRYVERVVQHHYDTEEKLEGDWELKEWRQELAIARENGGVGLVGIPGDDQKGFSSVEEVVETIAIIISTCSLGHAASNFQQYNQYAFVPNYPGILLNNPPTDKRDFTEAEIVNMLPNMTTTLETILITKLLSQKATKSLGDFEMQYLYHPQDVAAAEEFKNELKKLSLEIQRRNIDRGDRPFDWLNPTNIPNAISI